MLKHQKEAGLTSHQMGRNYGSPVVAETCDWWLNDVSNTTLSESDVQEAIDSAMSGDSEVQEGQNGGGAGMTCHMFTGGTGTSSRLVDGEKDGETVIGQYTVGVLVQSNYGFKSDMQIGGLPVGKMLIKEDGKMVVPYNEANDVVDKAENGGRMNDGSIVIIIM
jgi:D-aminopeptidase